MLRSLCLALAVTVAGSSAALACSCAPPPPPKKALEQASAVFSGKVTKIEGDGKVHSVTIEIARTWKGPGEKQLVVVTANNGAACGYGFKMGESYLVYCYATDADGTLRTNLCTRTKPLKSAKDDLKDLGEGQKPGDE